LDQWKGEHSQPCADREGAGGPRRQDTDAERDRRGGRSKGEPAADEGHDRLAAAKASEERERVTQHRGADRHVGPPSAGETETGEAGERTLEAVAGEGRPGAAGAELLQRVPGAGIAVGGLVEIHAVSSSHQGRERHGAEQITDDGGRPVLD
jgi:hypothetical protein